MPEKKSQAKPLQPEEKKKPIFLDDNNEVIEPEVIPPVAMKPERSYTIDMIEAVVNKYYESKGNKTPLLVERSDLLEFIKKNL